MPMVDLEPNEWGQVMAILSTAPWRDANPLLMRIGNQLRTAPPGPPHPPVPPDPPDEGEGRFAASLRGNGQ